MKGEDVLSIMLRRYSIPWGQRSYHINLDVTEAGFFHRSIFHLGSDCLAGFDGLTCWTVGSPLPTSGLMVLQKYFEVIFSKVMSGPG